MRKRPRISQKSERPANVMSKKATAITIRDVPFTARALTRLSQLEGVTICKVLQISATVHKVCTKVIGAAVVLSG
jgi:hypothetical protein